jgi:hypothetical protein
LDPRVEAILKDVQLMVRDAEFKEAQLRANETAQRKAMETVDEMKKKLHKKEFDRLNESNELAGDATIGKDSKISSNGHLVIPSNIKDSGMQAESTAVVRRENRKERKVQLMKHVNEKPSEDADDVRDLQVTIFPYIFCINTITYMFSDYKNS